MDQICIQCHLCGEQLEVLGTSLLLPYAHSCSFRYVKAGVVVDFPKCLWSVYKTQQEELKDLMENERLEGLNNLSSNDSHCCSCNEKQVVKFCVDCDLRYCSTSLYYNGGNPTSKAHRLQEPECTAEKINSVNNRQICQDHLEEMNSYCENCKAFLCEKCSNHEEHHIKHMSVKFDEVKDDLNSKIKTKENRFQEIVDNFKSAEEKLDDCKTKAMELKEKIQRRGEEVKKVVDSIVAEMNDNINKELAQHEKEAGVVLAKLKEMQTDLNAQIETLKQQLNNLNCHIVIEMSKKNSDEISKIPSYSKDFKMYCTPICVYEKTDLEYMIGSLSNGVELKLFKDVDVDSSSTSFAVGQKHLYVINNKKIDAFCVPKLTRISSTSLENYLLHIHDIEVFDEILYVCGKDTSTQFAIYETEIIGFYKVSAIYKSGYVGNVYTLSKTKDGNLIVTEGKKILIITRSGRIHQTLNFPESIFRAVGTDDQLIVCTRSGVCVVDGCGSEAFTFFRDFNSNCSFKVALDKYKNVFIYNRSTGLILVYDNYNKLVTSGDIGKNVHVHKIYFDKHRNILFALMQISFCGQRSVASKFKIFHLNAKKQN